MRRRLLLITEIIGGRISEIDESGNVLYAFIGPTFYPSDAQLTARGTIVGAS